MSGTRSATPQSGAPVGTTQPSASASVSTSPSAGPAVLSAQAVSPVVPAGTSATINGMLTSGTTADGGVFVRLMAHVVGRPGWVFVGRSQTSAQGAVSFTTPVLKRNTWFRLADASGTRSSVVVITVTPSISATLRAGPQGVKDYVTVSTTAARKGDVVLLQVLQNGTWVTFKQATLNIERQGDDRHQRHQAAGPGTAGRAAGHQGARRGDQPAPHRPAARLTCAAGHRHAPRATRGWGTRGGA